MTDSHAPPENAPGDGAPKISESGAVLRLSGDYVTVSAAAADAMLAAVAPGAAPIVMDLSAIGHLDTAGALVLHKHRVRLGGNGSGSGFSGASAAQLRLLEAVGHIPPPPAVARARRYGPVFVMLAMVGEGAVEFLEDGRAVLSMLGEFLAAMLRIVTLKSSIRSIALVSHLDRCGVQAVPIIALMNFLIGMILAQQGGFYLRSFGGQLFVVNLVGVLVTREIGVLITAIMVAGPVRIRFHGRNRLDEDARRG